MQRIALLLGMMPFVFAAPSISSVVNAASFAPVITAGSWISIAGTGLADSTESWTADDIVDGQLPTTLGGVTVSVDGKPAFISYISPTQINAQAPDDSNSGFVSVMVTTPEGSSNAVNADLEPASPGLFLWPGSHVVAQHLDYSDLGPPGLFEGASTTPASPGETVVVYGTGFGATYPPVAAGIVPPGAPPLPSQVRATVNGESAAVTYAGIVAGAAGLYQLNLVVPPDAAAGDLPVVIYYLGTSSEPGALLNVAP